MSATRRAQTGSPTPEPQRGAAKRSRGRQRPKSGEPVPTEYDGVPTADHLIRLGLATRTATGHIHITAEGHALLGKALHNNAIRNREEGIWNERTGLHEPPHRNTVRRPWQ